MTGTGTMLTLRGTGNKRGCAIGKTEYLPPQDYAAPSPAGEPRRELLRLENAICESREELLTLYRALASELGEGEAWIFLMQIYLLDGSLFSDMPRFYIAEGKSADEALLLSHEYYLRELSRAPYVRDVTEDVRDLTSRVMRHLSGSSERRPNGENFILLSPSPTPSEIYGLSDALIGVVAKRDWERTSAAALTRALFIPAVFTDGDFGEEYAQKNAIIDSLCGSAYVDPDLQTVESFTQRRRENPLFGTSAHKRKLPLLAEPESLLDASRIHEGDLDGIGLFHSEELYLRSVSPPDEETLFETYRTLAESLLPKPLVIRTFSALGGVRVNKLTTEDKNEPELYVFHDESLLRQLRAALRAAVFGTLALAVPCGGSYHSLQKVKELVSSLSDELRAEGREHRELPVGVIIDSPAAAIVSDKLLDSSDFIILRSDATRLEPCEGDLASDAERYILERVARTAKRKKKPALLCLSEDAEEQDLLIAKKLGFSALVIPPDTAERFE